MKLKITLIIVIALMGFTVPGDNIITVNLSQSLSLNMESFNGTNGCAVAYNPKYNVYYAAIAGNKGFPLEVFSYTGNHLYTGTTMCDLRSIWVYKNKLYASSAGNSGFYSYQISTIGYPITISAIGESTKPDFNSSGAFSQKGKKIYYYHNGKIYLNKLKSDNIKALFTLQLPSGTYTGDINAHSVIYTGKKSREIGVLDYSSKRVLLYNVKNGALTGICKLPNDTVCDDRFGFSFANGYIWLYDKKRRVWEGFYLNL